MFGREHQLVAGLNYAKMSYTDTSLYDYTTGFGFPVLPALESWNSDTPQPTFADGLTGSEVTNKQTAIYFTARFELQDNLHLITGGRYNDWQVSGTSYNTIQDASDKEFIPYLVPERKSHNPCYIWAVAINSKRRFKLTSRY